MERQNDPVRRDNRKALPKFILFFTLSLIGGGVVGFLLATFTKDADLPAAVRAAGMVFGVRVAPWLLCAFPVVQLALFLPLYQSAKARLARWDGEDEAASDAIEGRLSVALWSGNLLHIAAMFLLAAVFGTFSKQTASPLFFVATIAFLITLLLNLVTQQRIIDLTRRLYPEKRGSVYDMRFQKKWLASCDEAERAVIGQCAQKAYSAVTYACLVLWMVLVIAGLFLGTGFLPVLAVCVIWAVAQSVYCYWSFRLNRPGTAI